MTEPFMDTVQEAQEKEYAFPYHHLVEIAPFSETKHLWWGFKYAAYLERVLELLSTETFASIADLGCGDGKLAFELHKRFPRARIVGLDYSERSLRFARAFSPHLTFLNDTDESFDAFVMMEVLEHIPPASMDGFVEWAAARLRPGGIGIITTPSVNLPIQHKHYQHFTEASARSALEKRFVVESCEHLHAKNPGFIQRLLANRFFILNYPPAVRWLYERYKRAYLRATPETGTQLVLRVRKK